VAVISTGLALALLNRNISYDRLVLLYERHGLASRESTPDEDPYYSTQSDAELGMIHHRFNPALAPERFQALLNEIKRRVERPSVA
jgi:hypothetical protein